MSQSDSAKHRQIGLCVLALLLVMFSDTTQAQVASPAEAVQDILEKPPAKLPWWGGLFTFDAGVSTWLSKGNTKWSHDASVVNPVLGNPTSELEYKDLWSNVIQLDGRVGLRNGVFVGVQYGYGTIDDGTLVDDDFAAGQVLASRTESDVDADDLWFINADVGLEFLEFAEGKGRLRAFVGYQHWEETVVAKGVTQIVSNTAACIAIFGVPCAPAGSISNVGENAITNKMTWDSIRLGLSGLYRLTRYFSVDGRVAFVPYANLHNDDVHHLRPDLRKDPSFSMSGQGFGVNAEGQVSYNILRALTFDVGFRFWWLEVRDGNWTTHPINGAARTLNLNKFRSLRYGATVGLNYHM